MKLPTGSPPTSHSKCLLHKIYSAVSLIYVLRPCWLLNVCVRRHWEETFWESRQGTAWLLWWLPPPNRLVLDTLFPIDPWSLFAPAAFNTTRAWSPRAVSHYLSTTCNVFVSPPLNYFLSPLWFFIFIFFSSSAFRSPSLADSNCRSKVFSLVFKFTHTEQYIQNFLKKLKIKNQFQIFFRANSKFRSFCLCDLPIPITATNDFHQLTAFTESKVFFCATFFFPNKWLENSFHKLCSITDSLLSSTAIKNKDLCITKQKNTSSLYYFSRRIPLLGNTVSSSHKI